MCCRSLSLQTLQAHQAEFTLLRGALIAWCKAWGLFTSHLAMEHLRTLQSWAQTGLQDVRGEAKVWMSLFLSPLGHKWKTGAQICLNRQILCCIVSKIFIVSRKMQNQCVGIGTIYYRAEVQYCGFILSSLSAFHRLWCDCRTPWICFFSAPLKTVRS